MIQAKDKFREGWIRIKRLHTFAELSFPIQPFTVCYAYTQSDITEKYLKSDVKEILYSLYDAIDGNRQSLLSLSGNLPIEFRKGVFEKDKQYRERIEKQIEFIESSESSHATEFKGQIVETYFREGDRIVPVRFYPDEYTTPEQELIDMMFEGNDWMMKINNKDFFEQSLVKDKVFYSKTRGIPEDIAKKWCATNAKEAIWFKPKEGILFNFCRKNQVQLPDEDYCKEFHETDF